MDAISAIDVLTRRKPTQQMKNIQIKPAVPPLISPIVETLRERNGEHADYAELNCL
jgi:hypothetical protein